MSHGGGHHGSEGGMDMNDMKDSATTPSMIKNHGSIEHSMKMYFHATLEDILLFEKWRMNSAANVALACIVIIIFAVLYEALKMIRQDLYRRDVMNEPLLEGQRRIRCSWLHALQTGLYMVQTLMSLILMLVFMTFNIFLCLSVILGAGIGYSIFGSKHAAHLNSGKIADDHCMQ